MVEYKGLTFSWDDSDKTILKRKGQIDSLPFETFGLQLEGGEIVVIRKGERLIYRKVDGSYAIENTRVEFSECWLGMGVISVGNGGGVIDLDEIPVFSYEKLITRQRLVISCRHTDIQGVDAKLTFNKNKRVYKAFFEEKGENVEERAWVFVNLPLDGYYKNDPPVHTVFDSIRDMTILSGFKYRLLYEAYTVGKKDLTDEEAFKSLRDRSIDLTFPVFSYSTWNRAR